MTAKIYNMSIRYVMLVREDGAIYLIYNPVSKRIVKQWSPFQNGDQVLMYKDLNDVLGNLLGRGWEYREEGEYE